MLLVFLKDNFDINISESEVERTKYVDDNYFVIYPQLNTGRTYFHTWDSFEFNIKPPLSTHGLSSADNLKTKDFLRELLKKGGWL